MKKHFLRTLLSTLLIVTFSHSMEEAPSPFSWPELPEDVQLSIFMAKDDQKHLVLSEKELTTLLQVSTVFNRLIKNGHLWQQLSLQSDFNCHPNTAFKSHYHYLKGKKIYEVCNGDFTDTNTVTQLIESLNKSAPLMHFGSIDLLMELMNSPNLPVETECIYLPKELNLTIYPFLTEKEILDKSEDDFLWIVNESEFSIIKNSCALRERYFGILKAKELDCYSRCLKLILNAYDQRYTHDTFGRKTFQTQLINIYSENREKVLAVFKKAKYETDFPTLNILTAYFILLKSSTDKSSESSDSSEESESNDTVDNQIFEEVTNLLEEVDKYIQEKITLTHLFKMTYYFDEIPEQIENYIEKEEEEESEKIEIRLNQLCDLMKTGHFFPFHVLKLSQTFCEVIDEKTLIAYQNIANYSLFLGMKLLRNCPSVGYREELFGEDYFLSNLPHSYPICLETPLDQRMFLSLCSLANTFYEDRHYGEIFEYLLDQSPYLPLDWNTKGLLSDPEFCKKHLGFDTFALFQRHLSDSIHENLLRLMERTTDNNSLIDIYEQFVRNLNFSRTNPTLALKFAKKICKLDTVDRFLDHRGLLCNTLIIAQEFDKAQELIKSLNKYEKEKFQCLLDKERANVTNNGNAP